MNGQQMREVITAAVQAYDEADIAEDAQTVWDRMIGTIADAWHADVQKAMSPEIPDVEDVEEPEAPGWMSSEAAYGYGSGWREGWMAARDWRP
jgi:hypothetical protein